MKNKSLATIFIIVFIDLLGFGIILPLLPFIAGKYNANPFQIGLLAATYSFFQFIASPVLGMLSDRFGRKKILIISQIGSAIGFLLLGLARSLPLFFLSRAIDGITGGNISIAQAYIADVTEKKDRARGMALIGVAFGMGFIFGPSLGGFLSTYSLSLPAFIAMGISLITVVSTAVFLKETVKGKQMEKLEKKKYSFFDFINVLKTEKFLILATAFFLFSFAVSSQQGIFALWTEKSFNFGPKQNGVMFAYVGVLSIIVQALLLPAVLKKFKEKDILLSAIIFLIFGLFGLTIVKNPSMLFLVLVFMPLGNGFAGPTLQAIASENVNPEEYGETMGYLQSFGSLGRIAGPALAGLLFSLAGKNSPFVFACFLLSAIYFILRKKL